MTVNTVVKKRFNDVILYAKDSVKALNEDAWVQDYFFVGKPSPMNILAEMFDDIFGKNVNYDMKNYEGPVLMHCLQPYHLIKRGIHISTFKEGGVLIRDSYRFNKDMSPETTSITVGNNTIKQQANTNTGWSKILPSDTLSPIFTFNSEIFPSKGDGTSTLDLSLSKVTIGSFFLIWSPGFTKTSIISTSLKSPISGTGIFFAIIYYTQFLTHFIRFFDTSI